MNTVIIIDHDGIQELELPPMRYKLYKILVDDPDRVFRHDELWKAYWGFIPSRDNRSTADQIRLIRTSFAEIGIDLIKSHQGFGYSYR